MNRVSTVRGVSSRDSSRSIACKYASIKSSRPATSVKLQYPHRCRQNGT
jgi:hypothetical protein